LEIPLGGSQHRSGDASPRNGGKEDEGVGSTKKGMTASKTLILIRREQTKENEKGGRVGRFKCRKVLIPE